MRLIVEEHRYPVDKVKDVLDGISTLRDVDGLVSVNYVGYYYNPTLKDCVFILPKVLLDEQEKVFGHCSPEDIIDLENQDCLTQEEHDFIYELSVWIYRAIVVYQDSKPQNNIVLKQNVQQMAKGRLRQCNTFLDILLAMLKFNRENQDFFFFILRNIHSGYNKINWTRTISHTSAIVQDNSPVYLNPVNKKRQINFDEELLIIFFSILNYINEQYGFPVQINVNFPLIKGEMFEHYRKEMGKAKLMQIKYKYFSDKALYLWELCYAFFDQSKKINVETDDKEYLLVKNFNIVFEAIIDELVGAPESETPSGLKDQGDGKRVDHIYQYKDLIHNEEDKPVYYIGDSKYYKRGAPIGENSVYKQFTYARNVIQWNLDLFNDSQVTELNGHIKLRDDVTEGYNVIPNFFISAQQNTLGRSFDIQPTTNEQKYYQSKQFDNRLFDRDTFLIAHYDVNFLFVVALYGRNNKGEKSAWKEKVRGMFRREIQAMLEQNFNFYAFTAKEGVNAAAYIDDHFQELLGKIFTPYPDREGQKYFSVALDNRENFSEANETLLNQLKENFYVEQCEHISDDPKALLPEVAPFVQQMAVPSNFLTYHYLEKYADKLILIGCYHNQAHLNWILGNNDKGTLIYNVRLDKSRPGAQKITQLSNNVACFVILYEQGHEHENKYRVFHVHHHATMTEERMRKARYPEPQGKYFCYVFDEEVTLGNLDIAALIANEQKTNTDFIQGYPIFKTGKELIKYRKHNT